MSCILGDVSLHLLGYLFDPTESDRLQPSSSCCAPIAIAAHRRWSTSSIELGAPVTWAAGQCYCGRRRGRSSAYRAALVAAGVVADVPAAFVPEWIANDGRAYVEKYSLDAGAGDRAGAGGGGRHGFRAPCGVVARCDVVDEAAIEAFAAAGLDGLEVDHPDHDEATRAAASTDRDEPRLAGDRVERLPRVGEGIQIGANTTAPEVFDALVQRAHRARWWRR